MAESAPATPAEIAHLRKLRTAARVATDVLSRIEKTLRDNPSAVAGTKTQMLSRELEDKHAYFLEKTATAQKTLNEIASLLPTASEDIALHEQIALELMSFLVVIESFRPRRVHESGWDPGVSEDAIRAKLDSLVLDAINMRERLK